MISIKCHWCFWCSTVIFNYLLLLVNWISFIWYMIFLLSVVLEFISFHVIIIFVTQKRIIFTWSMVTIPHIVSYYLVCHVMKHIDVYVVVTFLGVLSPRLFCLSWFFDVIFFYFTAAFKHHSTIWSYHSYDITLNEWWFNGSHNFIQHYCRVLFSPTGGGIECVMTLKWHSFGWQIIV